MHNFRRSARPFAFGIVLFLSAMPHAAAAAGSCASVAKDPSSINTFKDSPGFADMVATLSSTCPEVLSALDIPLDEILSRRTAPDTTSGRDSEERTPVFASPDETDADRVAVLRAATKALAAATADVRRAEARVQQAMDRVASLSDSSMAQSGGTAVSLTDIASARRDAARELRRARAELDRKIDAHANAVTVAAAAISQAESDLDRAKADLAKASDGADAEKRMAELKEKYEAILKDAAQIEEKQAAMVDTARKIDAQISELKDKIGKGSAAIDAAIIRSSEAKQAIASAELALKEGKGSESDLKDAKMAYEQAETDIKNLMGEVDSLKKEIAQADENRMVLEKEGATIADKLAQIRAALPDLQSDHDRLSAAVDSVSKAEGMVAAAQAEAKSSTTVAVEQKQDAEQQAAKSEARARDLISLSETEKALLAEGRAASDGLAEAVSALDAHQDVARSQLEQTTQTAPRAVQEAAAALADGLDAAEAREEAARETGSEIDRQIEDVTRSVEDLKSELDGPAAF